MIDYELINKQVEAFIEVDDNLIGILGNVSAILKEAGGWHWVGFYLVDSNSQKCGKGEELLLGPFQGPPACLRIKYGKGVCGTAWKMNETLVVPDVDAFPGHIACSSLSRSEVVVPINEKGKVVAVLDIDSKDLDDFSKEDVEGLEMICASLAALWR